MYIILMFKNKNIKKGATMKTDKYGGWITWAEANIECGLPERYRRSTQVPYFHDDIIAIKPKDRNETVYYLRRGNESN